MDEDDEDPRDLHLEEIEGYRVIQGDTIRILVLDYHKPIKTKKHNILTEEKLKMEIVGDYWNEEIMTEIVDLVKEYQYIFPSIFYKIKGISGELGDMRMQLHQMLSL